MNNLIQRPRIESKREPHEPIWRDAIAEIEALRSELAEWKASFHQAAEGHAVCAERAERLVEALKSGLGAVRDVLQDAYNRAGLGCCGRGSMHGCCGSPEPVWTAEDEALMEKLGSAERVMSAALRSDQEAGA